MLIVHLFQLLYGLSWIILFGGVVLVCFRPNPSEVMVTAMMVTIMGAFWYIAAHVVLRGIVRLLGYGHPAVPVPPDAVLMRRLILEEVIPSGSGQPEHRVVLEDVAPYYERHGHAR
jgi:hypothetical protein